MCLLGTCRFAKGSFSARPVERIECLNKNRSSSSLAQLVQHGAAEEKGVSRGRDGLALGAVGIEGRVSKIRDQVPRRAPPPPEEIFKLSRKSLSGERRRDSPAGFTSDS